MLDNMDIVHNVSEYFTAAESTVTATTEGTSEDKDFFLMAQFITGLILYPLVCIPGICGNIISIVVFSLKDMKSSTHTYLCALAVIDAAKLFNDLLYFIVILLFHTDEKAANWAYAHLYPYSHFAQHFTVCVSAWLVVCVAVERYVMVCHPARAKTLCTIFRARTICVVTYFLLFSFTLPFAFRYKTIRTGSFPDGSAKYDIETTDLWSNRIFGEVYGKITAFCRSVIPLLFLVVLNVFITIAIWRTRANRRQAARHRVSVMMVSIIIVFLICITPDAIMSCIGFGYHDSEYRIKGVREITDFLLVINSAANFVLYCIFNRTFWKHLKQRCHSNTSDRCGYNLSRSRDANGNGESSISKYPTIRNTKVSGAPDETHL